MSSLERLGEAGWLPDVRSEESLPGQACNQPTHQTNYTAVLRPNEANENRINHSFSTRTETKPLTQLDLLLGIVLS